MEKNDEPKTVKALIESDKFRNSVAQILPSHLTPARFVRIALAATTRTPKLAECDPASVLQCLITLSQFGLEPDGRNAHLIPFWNSRRNVYECQLIIDYKGLATLAKRGGQVSYIHADAVCEKDIFEFNKGVVVRHLVNFEDDRGKPYCYYAMVRFKDGTEQAACMTKAEIDKIRSRSRAKNEGPWVTDYEEMAKKTVFRRLSKWLDLSPEFRDAIEADADALEELRFENAQPLIRRAQVPMLEKNDETISPTPEILPTPVEAEGDSNPTLSRSGVGERPPEAEKKIKRKPGRPSTKNLKALLERLKVGDFTPEILMSVLENYTAFDGKTWPLSDEDCAKCLDEENWALIQEDLEARRLVV